jgi:hypothetical protein
MTVGPIAWFQSAPSRVGGDAYQAVTCWVVLLKLAQPLLPGRPPRRRIQPTMLPALPEEPVRVIPPDTKLHGSKPGVIAALLRPRLRVGLKQVNGFAAEPCRRLRLNLTVHLRANRA